MMSDDDQSQDTPPTTEMTTTTEQGQQAELVDWGTNDTIHNGISIESISTTRYEPGRK